MVSRDIKTTPRQHRGGRRKGSGKRVGLEGPPGLRLVQAMADRSRWAILELLAHESLGVVAIARRIDRSVGCTSRHVAILREAELVVVRREGKSLSCGWPAEGTAELEILRTLFSGAPIRPARPVARAATSEIPEFDEYRNVSRTPRRPSPDLDDFLL